MRPPVTTMRPVQGWGPPYEVEHAVKPRASGSGSAGARGGPSQTCSSLPVQCDVFSPDGYDPDTGHCQPETTPFLLAWSQVTVTRREARV